jgi:para-nitrobenzyl esterase
MSDLIVETTHGKVRGLSRKGNGVKVFKGIPYGASTGGPNRFKAPQPPQNWSGVRDALEFGPPPAQTSLRPPRRGWVAEGVPDLDMSARASEDCLTINVWTPDCDGRGRPVIVAIPHSVAGSASNECDSLVSRGDVVAVSFNHRLGITGHLYLAEIVGDEYAESGNAATLDMIAALEWVRDNISAFGGDPARVTIWGCSGCGAETAILAAAPRAEGLFHRALISDAGSMIKGSPRFFHTMVAERVLDSLGIGPEEAHKLHEVSWQQLHECEFDLGELAFMLSAPYTAQWLTPFASVADGVVLPGESFDERAPECSSGVPMMIGNSRDTFNLMFSKLPWFGHLDDYGLRVFVESHVGREQADVVIAAERVAQPHATPSELAVAVVNHLRMHKTLRTYAGRRAIAGHAPTYMYRFDYEGAIPGLSGAFHGAELGFFFSSIDGEDAQLDMFKGLYAGRSDRGDMETALHEAFVRFAADGDPNHDGIPKWEPYSTNERATMLLDSPCTLAHDPDAELWQAYEGIETWGDKSDYIEALRLLDNFVKLPLAGYVRS